MGRESGKVERRKGDKKEEPENDSPTKFVQVHKQAFPMHLQHSAINIARNGKKEKKI